MISLKCCDTRFYYYSLLCSSPFRRLSTQGSVCVGEGDRLKGVGGEGKWGRKVSFPNPQQLNTLRVDH